MKTLKGDPVRQYAEYNANALGILDNLHQELISNSYIFRSKFYWTTILDFYDPTPGLPSDPANLDTYISTGTDNGWTVDYIYEYNAGTSSWDEYDPPLYEKVYVSNPNKNYTYMGSELSYVEVYAGHMHVLPHSKTDLVKDVYSLTSRSSSISQAAYRIIPKISDQYYKYCGQSCAATKPSDSKKPLDFTFTSDYTKTGSTNIPLPIIYQNYTIEELLNLAGTQKIIYNVESILRMGIELDILLEANNNNDNSYVNPNPILLGNLKFDVRYPMLNSTLDSTGIIANQFNPNADPDYTIEIPVYFNFIYSNDLEYQQKNIWLKKVILSPTTWDIDKVYSQLRNVGNTFLPTHTIKIDISINNLQTDVTWAPISVNAFMLNDFVITDDTIVKTYE